VARRCSGWPDPERATAYRLALATGFRVAELGSLTPGSFALDQTPPVVVCEGGYTKNGRKAEQPIPDALADALRPWLASRPIGCRVFALPRRTADMIRAALAAAGIAYETSAGVVDFHALRGAYILNPVSGGASVKTCQTLARHSTPSLTIGVYAKASLRDISGAVAGLPRLTTPRPAREIARATGTD
jgi:integrase